MGVLTETVHWWVCWCVGTEWVDSRWWCRACPGRRSMRHSLCLWLVVKLTMPAPLSPPTQADALAIGKNSQALRSEGVAEHLIPHKTFSGGWGAELHCAEPCCSVLCGALWRSCMYCTHPESVAYPALPLSCRQPPLHQPAAAQPVALPGGAAAGAVREPSGNTGGRQASVSVLVWGTGGMHSC